MERPKCDVPCVIRTKDGRELKATLIHLNGQYHSYIPKDELYQWRVGKHNYVSVKDVVEWRLDLDI